MPRLKSVQTLWHMAWGQSFYSVKRIMSGSQWHLPPVVLIIQYSSTVYRDHGGQGFLAPKYHPKTSLIYFVTSRHYGLGIAKLKNVFRSFLTHSKNLLKNFKFNRIFLRPTDSLTHLLMPSEKHNSITAEATGLSFVLFDVASSQNVPFCQPQQHL